MSSCEKFIAMNCFNDTESKATQCEPMNLYSAPESTQIGCILSSKSFAAKATSVCVFRLISVAPLPSASPPTEVVVLTSSRI